MKEAFWGWWIIALGLFIIVIIMVVTDMTTTSEQDYYMVREITEASMYEAVDYGYYARYNKIKINSEKFMENFIRRYSEVISINKTVDISFYDIYEYPPKVTVVVKNKSIDANVMGTDMEFNIENRVDAILEMKIKDQPVIEKEKEN